MNASEARAKCETERIWMTQSGIGHSLPVYNWYCPESLKRDLEETSKREPRGIETRETWGESGENPEKLRRELKQNPGEKMGRLYKYLGRYRGDPTSLHPDYTQRCWNCYTDPPDFSPRPCDLPHRARKLFHEPLQ